jgi:amino acid adenylation domain-containing protein
MRSEKESGLEGAELYAELLRRNVQVSVEGDELRLRTPRGGLPPELKERIVAQKPALIALLRAAQHRSRSSTAPEDRKTTPASWAQEGLWLHDQLVPGRSAYNVAITVRLVGPLDTDALERALGEILRRHDTLRTRFEQEGEGPVQVIEPPGAFTLRRLELRHSPDPEGEARRLAGEEAERPFRLDDGLWRAVLLVLGEREHLLLWTVHHSVFDGWSTRVFLREIEVLYSAYSTGAPARLPPLPLQYADFARLQREASSGKGLASQLAYWKQRLAHAPPPLELPLDKARPSRRSFQGERLMMELPARQAAAVEDFCRAEGVTPFMLLLAAYKVLLFRLTGQGDLCVGTPLADRPEGSEGLIGLFIQMLVIRTGLSDDPPFRVLLGRVRTAALEARANADVPFEQLVTRLHPARHPCRTPFFQVMFNLINLSELGLRLPGLQVEVTETLPGSRFELTLYAYPRPGALQLVLAYDTELFERPRMEALLEQFSGLLEQIVAGPGRRLTHYSLAGREAVARLPQPSLPLEPRWESSVLARFALQAQRVPERVALAGPRDHWTYAELDERSRWLANWLRAGGVRPGELVAIFGHRSPALAGAMLGTWRAGAAFLILDPGYPALRLVEYLRIAQPVALIELESAGPLPGALAAHLEAAPPRCRLQLHRDGAIPAIQGDALSWEPEEAPEALAYVAFTSGSTGVPKAIAGTHRPLSHFLDWHVHASGLSEDDRFGVLSGLAHDPLLRDLFTPLWLGATAVMPGEDERVEGRSLAEWLRREGISVLHVTPPLAEMVVMGTRERSLPALRHIFFGGDVLRARLVRALRRCAPAARLVNFYGATETPQAMGFYPVPEPLPENVAERLPVGRGIEGVQLLVLRPDGALAGVGELGEIHVRTPYLSRGYLGDEAATRERFLPDPFSAGGSLGRMYRTGDLGRYRPDGTVELVGRADRQVKIRGHRVEPGEVERVLCEHPAVARAAVVMRADSAGEEKLVAYVVPTPGQEPPAHMGALVGFLRARLPAALVPAVIVSVGELPLTPNGKLDVAALPMPEGGTRGEGGPPRTPVEVELVGLWEELLSISPIGVHDEFFELGGHSLLAVRLLDRVEKRFGRHISLSSFFQGATVERLARLLRDAPGHEEDVPQLIPLRVAGVKPAFVCVAPPGARARAHFSRLARYLDPERPLFALQLPAFGRGASASVEALAGWCRSAVLQTLGGAPLHLGGFSNGGIVAFELARQLARDGQGPRAVALFDTRAPSSPGAEELSEELWLTRFAAHLAQGAAAMHGSAPPSELLKLEQQLPVGDAETRLGWLLDVMRRHAGVAQATTLAEFNEVFKSYRSTSLCTAEIVARYAPEPWDARLLVIRARDRWQGRGEPALGWGKLTCGTIECADLAGTHETLLEEPFVSAVADRLRRWLDDADAILRASRPTSSTC